MNFCFMSEELLEEFYSDNLYDLFTKVIVDAQKYNRLQLSSLSDYEIRLLYDLRKSFKHSAISSLHDE